MQDYYNTIPAFGIGGLIAKIAKAAGRAKIQGHANLLSKEQPELSKLLSKLAKSQQGGPKLSDEEAKKLATLAQNYRRSNIHYQNRRSKINEQIAARRKQPETPQNPSQSAPVKPGEQPNPVPGTTLSGRWKQAKQWINNHPKTVVGGALFLGSGTGRDILSKAGSLYSARPFTSSSAADQQVVTINGVDIPITKSSNGKFVPVSAQVNNSSPTPTNAGDDIDALINSAKGETEASNTIQAQSQVPDQQTINDLFADDQDQWYQ